MKIIVPYGRSFEGVLKDIRQHYGAALVEAVVLPTDKPLPMTGVVFVLSPSIADGDIVVLNGGTTAQQWTIVSALLRRASSTGAHNARCCHYVEGADPSEMVDALVAVVNLQRDGITVLGMAY